MGNEWINKYDGIDEKYVVVLSWIWNTDKKYFNNDICISKIEIFFTFGRVV
jgi:hypothetical protein